MATTQELQTSNGLQFSPSQSVSQGISHLALQQLSSLKACKRIDSMPGSKAKNRINIPKSFEANFMYVQLYSSFREEATQKFWFEPSLKNKKNVCLDVHRLVKNGKR